MKKLHLIIPVALILCLMIGCQDKEAMAELDSMKAQSEVMENNKDLARRFMEEAWGKGNQDVVDELLADNFILQNPPQDVIPTKDGYKEWIGMIGSVFSVVETTLDDIIAEGDKVVIRWTYTSTLKSEYMGIPPSDNQIIMTGMSIDRFENGKIVEEWIEMDQLGMMMQMGMEIKPKEEK